MAEYTKEDLELKTGFSKNRISYLLVKYSINPTRKIHKPNRVINIYSELSIKQLKEADKKSENYSGKKI
jgi:hypothetical protein